MMIDVERSLATQFASYKWRPEWTAVGHFLCSVSAERYVYWQTAENVTIVDMETGNVMYMCPLSYIEKVGRVWEPSKKYFGQMFNKEDRMSGSMRRATIYTCYSNMTLWEKLRVRATTFWKEVQSYVEALGV